MAWFYSQRERCHSSKCKEREMTRHDRQRPERTTPWPDDKQRGAHDVNCMGESSSTDVRFLTQNFAQNIQAEVSSTSNQWIPSRPTDTIRSRTSTSPVPSIEVNAWLGRTVVEMTTEKCVSQCATRRKTAQEYTEWCTGSAMLYKRRLDDRIKAWSSSSIRLHAIRMHNLILYFVLSATHAYWRRGHSVSGTDEFVWGIMEYARPGFSRINQYVHDRQTPKCTACPNVLQIHRYYEYQLIRRANRTNQNWTRCRAIAGWTVRCRCKFRYTSNFTTASCGFFATAWLSCWYLSADCSELSVKSDKYKK